MPLPSTFTFTTSLSTTFKIQHRQPRRLHSVKTEWLETGNLKKRAASPCGQACSPRLFFPGIALLLIIAQE